MSKTMPIETGYVMYELATVQGSYYNGFCPHTYDANGKVTNVDVDDKGNPVTPTGQCIDDIVESEGAPLMVLPDNNDNGEIVYEK